MLTMGTSQDRTRGTTQKPRFGHRSLALVGWMALLCILPLRAADPPTVTFSLDFPGSDPEHYTIAVQSDGRARYECSAKISPDSEDRETYQTEFNFSDATRARVFDLAAQALAVSQELRKKSAAHHQAAVAAAEEEFAIQ